MNTVEAVDTRFYEVVKEKSAVERLVVIARDRIYADFLAMMKPLPHEFVLDVGSSDVFTEAANVLERKYEYPRNLTAVGLGEPEGFRQVFPEINYQKIVPNERLPFADNTFDIATSNAVIEHVGSQSNQMFFVSELARVARRVFITAPNAMFPVEHHTAIPLLHFWDKSFKVACKLAHKESWLDPAELILMKRKKLMALAPKNIEHKTGYTGIILGPFSSNIYLSLNRPQ